MYGSESFANLGHYNASSLLILNFDIGSSVKSIPGIPLAILQILLKANYYKEALALSEKLFEHNNIDFQKLIFSGWALTGKENSLDRNAYRDFLIKKIKKEEIAGDKEKLGIAHYNLGNHLRSQKINREAIFHYRKAAEFAPIYLERAYFFQELAGILFGSKRYRKAVDFYRRAIELNDKKAKPLWFALYGDALMHAGNYSEALRNIENYLKLSEDQESEWILKRIVLDNIVNKLRISKQKRKVTEANKCNSLGLNISDEENISKLQHCITLDAINGFAWHNLGVSYNHNKQESDTSLAFLTCSLIQTGNISAWLNTLFSSTPISSGVPTHGIVHIIKCAYFFNGEEFVQEVYKYLNEHQSGDSTEIIKILDEIVSSFKKKKEIIELRMLGEEKFLECIPAPTI